MEWNWVISLILDFFWVSKGIKCFGNRFSLTSIVSAKVPILTILFGRAVTICRFNRLQSLVFSWTHKVDDTTIAKLVLANPNLKNSLQSLEIHRCSGMLSTDLEIGANIRVLGVDDRSAKRIAQFKNLRCLKLYNSSNWKGITDAGMKQLCKLSNLQVLQLNFFKRLTNKSMKRLRKLKDLRELCIFLFGVDQFICSFFDF